MMKLKKPNFSLKDVYPSCISHYKDPNKEKLMKSITPKLLEDEKRYLERMKNQELYLEPKNQTHNDKITPQDLIDLYKQKLLKKKYDVREYYDIIRLSSKVCPFCGKRQTSTVDHFLAKAVYTNFTVTLINLIPCCKDCNTNKNAADFTEKEKVFFHPYEEDTDSFSWLIAKILVKSKELIFDFSVTNQDIDEITYQRMDNQFNLLKLKNFYSEEATIKFNRTKEFYKLLISHKNGIEALKSHFLTEQIKYSMNENYINSFEYVYYKALIEYFDIVLTALKI